MTIKETSADQSIIQLSNSSSKSGAKSSQKGQINFQGRSTIPEDTAITTAPGEALLSYMRDSAKIKQISGLKSSHMLFLSFRDKT